MSFSSECCKQKFVFTLKDQKVWRPFPNKQPLKERIPLYLSYRVVKKRKAEVASNGVNFISNFVKSDQLIQKLK